MHHRARGAPSHPAPGDIGRCTPASRRCQKASAARTYGVKDCTVALPHHSRGAGWRLGGVSPIRPQQEVFAVTTLHRPAPAPRPSRPRRTPFPRVRPPVTHPARQVPDGTLARDLALPLGAVGAALLVTALMLTGETVHTSAVLALFALLTAAVSLRTRPLLVPLAALVSWMFYDGFVLHQRSELAFRPQDRTSLLVLLLAGVLGAVCAAAVRAVRRHPAG